MPEQSQNTNQSRAKGRYTSLLDTAPGMRKCSRCGTEYPLDQFAPRRRDEQGNVIRISATCRPCSAEIAREWRASNPEAAKRHEDKRADKRRERFNLARRITRIKNLETERARDKEKYELRKEKHPNYWAQYYHSRVEFLSARKKLFKELSWAQSNLPSGFLVIHIDPCETWRACSPSTHKPRARESVIAHLIPHPDGRGWKVIAWPVVDVKNQCWLQSIRRRVAKERREALIAAGIPAEVIVAELEAVR